MIRRFEKRDIEKVIRIWKETNLQAHSFIAQEYWEGHTDLVKQELPKSDVWIYEIENQIMGFAGLTGNYIAGIFVSQEFQSKGIGRELLSFIKEIYPDLVLHVYGKNHKAIKFYLREGFEVKYQQTDEATHETELVMVWKSETNVQGKKLS